MVLKKHAKMLLYAIICAAGIITAYSFFASYQTPPKISIRYDEQISPQAQNLIGTIIHRGVTEGKKARAMRAEIREHIPIINLLTINRRMPGTIRIAVKAERPHVLVTHIPATHWVLSQQGNYAPYNQYDLNAREGLPQILIESEMFSKSDKQELYNFIQQILNDFSNFFERYSVIWLKATNILLKDKNDSLFYIATTTKTRFTPDLQNKLNQIYQQVVEKRKTKKWNKKLWKADVRFKDQIVLSPIKNGKGPRS